MVHIELARSENFSHFVPFGPGQTRHTEQGDTDSVAELVFPSRLRSYNT